MHGYLRYLVDSKNNSSHSITIRIINLQTDKPGLNYDIFDRNVYADKGSFAFVGLSIKANLRASCITSRSV